MKKLPVAPSKAGPGQHPIAVVAERTGLSRDVLRVWERRYGAVEPTRTPGGRRLYSDADVARFRLLATAIKAGRTIGSLAQLTSDQIARIVADDEHARPQTTATAAAAAAAETVAHLLALTRTLDGSGLDRALRRAMATHGMPVFLEEVVPEFMRSVGNEWHENRLSIGHEHLASAAVHAVLLDAVYTVPERPGAPRLLVATPSNTRHVLGALISAAAASLDGWAVLHLGADLPASEVVAAAAASGARAVALSVIYTDDPAATERELLAVRDALPATIRLIVGGTAALTRMPGLVAAPGVAVCAHIPAFRALLAREAAAA